jgi:hypothetical protein
MPAMPQPARRHHPVVLAEQAASQRAGADHDFRQQELELRTTTDLTREVHRPTTDLHRHVLTPAREDR